MALKSTERRMAKRQHKESNKKRVVSKAKMKNIKNLKRKMRHKRTPGEQKARLERRKRQTMNTYAELMGKQQKKAKKEMLQQKMDVDKGSDEVTGKEMMEMMAPDDLAYLVRMNKKTPLPDDEDEFPKEKALRNHKQFIPDDVRVLLPIKTKEGIVEARFAKKNIVNNINKKRTKKEVGGVELDCKAQKKNKTTVDFLVLRQSILEKKKVEIGCLASNFLALPEERLFCLKTLLDFLEEKNLYVKLTVRKYAAITLLQVFHRTIPTYRIIEPVLPPNVKLKRETLKIVDYEKPFLATYQKYLEGLENMVKTAERNKDPALKSLGALGARCLGELLVQHSHFNFTTNIIQALVPHLNSKDDDVVEAASSAITKVFKNDVSGRWSLEIVHRIDQVVRRRAYAVRPSVFEVLLHLRLKGALNLDSLMEQHNQEKKKLTHKEKMIKKLVDKKTPKKGLKEAKVFKKKRKLEEAMKEINRDRKKRQINEQHAEIIKIVFALYVHVLKRRPNNKLNTTVLEGLAKFSHLINIEYFADLLSVLGTMMNEGSLKLRESLHCIQVVFSILAGQGQILTLDPTSFYQYLYANFFNISAAVSHDDIVTVSETLQKMLVERGTKAGQVRILSFAKRLLSHCLTLLHNGSITTLATFRNILLSHNFTEALLEVDSEGCSGFYDAESSDPQHCNPSASTLWELHLLKRHYHSTVRQMSHHFMLGAPLQGQHSLPHTLTKRSLHAIYESYSLSEMRFNPSVPPPAQHFSSAGVKAAKRRRLHGPAHWATEYMATTVQDLSLPDIHQEGGQGVFRGQDADQDISDTDFHAGLLSSTNLLSSPLDQFSDFPDYTQSLLCGDEDAPLNLEETNKADG